MMTGQLQAVVPLELVMQANPITVKVYAFLTCNHGRELSHLDIAQRIGVSKPSVQRAVVYLRGAEYLVVKETRLPNGSPGPNRYWTRTPGLEGAAA